MIARTETIRAHHMATIQEYRNWAVFDIIVQAEWMTAGDNRVCDRCASMQGNIYTLDQIEGMIPLHPQCFIDMQTPIYTSEGWKQIGSIKIGDYVLTHKRRFRKVYALPRHIDKADVVTIKFKGDLKFSVTANHPILLENGMWKSAGDCVVGDKLMLLGNICKRCGKPIPYFRKYCSRTCLSKDITERQWTSAQHRKIVSEKNSIANLEQYASGKRDRNVIAVKANERIREMHKNGTPPVLSAESREKVRIATHTPEIRKKSSDRMKKNNPMHDPDIILKVQKTLKEFYHENPERRLNVRMAKHRKSNNMTSIEKKMSLLLDKIGVNYFYQYPILRYDVDFAIPELRIVIECDGEYWHQDQQKDTDRQTTIEKEGWFVLRYTDSKINKCFDEIESELSRVLCNHLGEYDLVSWPVKSIRKWKLKRNRTLYNLSVEEDESYIAKGVVVHNCRCIALPYVEGMPKISTEIMPKGKLAGTKR
jgi:very-short-patch-repair endonuclease